MTAYRYTVEVLFIILIINNLISNGGFIALFVASRKVRKAVSVFMISLAVADMIFGVLVVPFHLDHVISGGWRHGVMGCKLRTFAYVVAASASILSSCCVTVERYIKIIYPMRYSIIKNITCASAVLTTLWLYSLGSAAFIFLDLSSVPLNGVCTHSFPAKLFLSLFVLTYFIPLNVMLIIYVHICKITKRHRRQIALANTAIIPHTNRNASASRAKNLSIVCLLLCVFIVCWLPVSVFSLVLKTRYSSEMAWPKWTAQLYPFLNFVAFSNSLLSPLIYGFSNKHFKSILKRYFLKRTAQVNSLPTRSTPGFTLYQSTQLGKESEA